MFQFNLYNGCEFGNNKIQLAFIEPFKYYHIYFNAPHQLLAGADWNSKIATFFYQSFQD